MERPDATADESFCDLQRASVFECAPNVVVVVACENNSLNRPFRDAVVAGSLTAQALLQFRPVCIQTVIDTQPVVCDDVLPLSVSLFDFPPQYLIPRHAKVLLFTCGDNSSFTLRPPLTLQPSCLLCINTIVDATPALLPHKQRIKSVILAAYEQPSSHSDNEQPSSHNDMKSIISAAYEQSSSFNTSMVLKASLTECSKNNNLRAESSREEALDAAYVLAFLAFACEVMRKKKV